MRILVVEDEQDLNRILAKTLKAEGYSVDSCFDGVEALDYLEGAEYDAVVLDVMMPRMDGFSVLAQMRADGNETPVLFLTAKDSVSSRASTAAARPMSSPWRTSRSIPPRTMSRAAGARSHSRPRNLRCWNI